MRPQTNPPARFSDLAGDRSQILQVLEAISTRDGEIQGKMERKAANYIKNNPNWETEFGAEFDRDFQQYED